jgi:hypothetical protein
VTAGPTSRVRASRIDMWSAAARRRTYVMEQGPMLRVV